MEHIVNKKVWSRFAVIGLGLWKGHERMITTRNSTLDDMKLVVEHDWQQYQRRAECLVVPSLNFPDFNPGQQRNTFASI